MKRSLMKELKKWKKKPDRKPLLIQGARQVGKTWLIKEFGKTMYEHMIYLNFEEQPDLQKLFEKSLSAQYLIEQISLYIGSDISKSETLIVFDEIQACTEALTSLKYFYEQRPELNIVAAGSLLGVSLRKRTPFPVGKVNFLTLHSLSFSEFISASGNEILSTHFVEISRKETSTVVHDQLLELFKRYLFTGGMPAVVKSWINEKAPEKVREIQMEIVKAYQNDFSKYSTASEAIKIGEVWKTIPSILSKENKKFKYKDITPSARASTYRTAIEWLEKAGLINLSYCLKTPKIPMSGYSDPSIFKTYFHDVGLLGAMLNVPSKMIIEKDALFSEYNGAFIENFTASELLRSGEEELFYWSSKSDAEIDFISLLDDNIVPIEVKSGYSRRKKSLQSYNKKYSPKYLIRISPREFDISDNFFNIPIYEAGSWKKRIS